MSEILIGTSGWHYPSWKGPFFPRGLKLKDQLAYDGSQFRTTELNGVFYRTPTEEAVKGWRARSKAGAAAAATCSSISTMTRRARRHATRSG